MANSLDEIKDRHAVAYWAEYSVTVGSEGDVPLTVHCTTEVLEDKVGLHLADNELDRDAV